MSSTSLCLMLKTYGKAYVIYLLFIVCAVATPHAAHGASSVAKWKGGKSGAISLTFDDACPSQISLGIPALNARGLNGTFFVVTDWVVSWDAWKNASNLGHEIASHTVTHHKLGELSLSQAQEELAGSKAIIEAQIPAKKCLSLSYPFGDANDQVKAMAQPLYSAARGVFCQINNEPYDMYNLGACSPDDGVNVNQQADAAEQQGGWLIFFVHSLAGGTDCYGNWQIGDLTGFLDYLGTKNLWVGTMGDVAKYIKERESAVISVVSSSDNQIVLNLSDTLDDSIYDEPLTIRTEVPSNFTSTVVSQGTNVKTIDSVIEGATRVIYYDAIPDHGTISITPSSYNMSPVATNDVYSTVMNNAINQAAPGVLNNDTFSQGTSVSVQFAGGPTHGSLTLNANGSFIYTPDWNYVGSDSFTYTIDNGTTTSNVATANITITSSAELGSVSVSPAIVTGGVSSQGTVTLNGPAPIGGGIVTLASSNTSVVTVPPSVTVPENSTGMNFVVSTSNVLTQSPVSISATYNGVTRSTIINVNAPVASFLLSVVKGGDGTGVVTSTPAGINCGATCSANFDSGTSVSLVASPDPGSVFSGWSGACSGTGACTVTSAQSVTATFTRSSAVTAGLVAAYAFNEGTGTTVADASGNGLNGTISGASWVAGKDGNALSFNGVNNLVTVPASNVLDLTTGMTLEGWVYPTNSSGKWGCVLMKETSNFYAYGLYISPANHPVVFMVINGSEHGFEVPTNLTANTWSHLAATYDGTTLSVYVNGILKGSETISATIPASSGALRIGGNSIWATEYFTGIIDNVRIFDRALTNAEIQTDVNTPVGNVSAPPALSGVSLAPGSLVGGNSSVATVTLSAPAPSEGAVVTLTSSNASVAMVPESVMVPAGSTSTTFTISTTSVTTAVTVSVSAVFEGVTKSGSLTVNPAVNLSALTLSPTSLTGGGSSQGTVTLTAAAPSGGAVVSLGADSSAASVPASVTVASGTTTATFTISTTPVASATSVTITAGYGGVNKSATVTVNPPAIVSSLAVSPTSVSGGVSALGTVTLSAAAPSGGAVVSLGADSSAASVPASVTVASGTTTATFTISTSPVAAATSVAITAGYGGVNKSATVTVNPPVLSSLAVSPTSVVGGTASQGTVTLSGAAPSGGLTVTVSDNSTAASEPASVTVVGGTTTATFTISTSPVAAATPVTITAGYGGVNKSATVTVNPPVLSSLAVSPTSVVGGTASQGTVTLSGAAP
ncbi:LamG-like jellyroll fold domain-containing protein, partial [Geobacter sp. AOG2]|uniref:LamG-like jellyroll fold domain-containing protein n=1 Tax=Geobacter sp. AOG2 TaxID=1566347 RepID=UPI001CC33372